MTSVANCGLLVFDGNKKCSWCVNDLKPEASICVKTVDVDFYEDRHYTCAPHGTVRWGFKKGIESFANEDDLITQRHKPWGVREFCAAAEVLFGGADVAKAGIEEHAILKERLSDFTFMSMDSKEKKLTPTELETVYTSIWTSKAPAYEFFAFCRAIFGVVCAPECRELSEIYEEAVRPGLEGGSRGRYSEDRELDEGDYLQSATNLAVEGKGHLVDHGQVYVLDAMLGRRHFPAFRPQKFSGGTFDPVVDTYKLKYKMSAKDCARCLSDSVCFPGCLLEQDGPWCAYD